MNYGTRTEKMTKNTDYKKREENTDRKLIASKMDYKTISDKRAEKMRKKVYQYDLKLNLIKVWNSAIECGENGYDVSTVAKCCRRERKTHKKYIWRYEIIE